MSYSYLSVIVLHMQDSTDDDGWLCCIGTHVDTHIVYACTHMCHSVMLTDIGGVFVYCCRGRPRSEMWSGSDDCEPRARHGYGRRQLKRPAAGPGSSYSPRSLPGTYHTYYNIYHTFTLLSSAQLK